jgi:hypothetical protein
MVADASAILRISLINRSYLMNMLRNFTFIAIALLLSNVSFAKDGQKSPLSTFEQFRLTE